MSKHTQSFKMPVSWQKPDRKTAVFPAKSNRKATVAKEPKYSHKPTGRRNVPLHSAKLTILRQLAKRVRQKKSKSANMAPDVTQKRSIFATNSAKTALANYLLLTKVENI